MKKLLQYCLAAGIWVALWAVASHFAGLELLLPSPAATMRALSVLAREGSFYTAVGLSLVRIASGFLLGSVIGTALAVLASLSSALKIFFSPLLSCVKATPVASFIILALVWLERGGVPAFTSALIVIPVFFSNIFTGLTCVDEKLLEMARAFGTRRSRLIKKLYIPSVLPHLGSAVTSGLGMAWKAGIAAEVICTPRTSIGSQLYTSKVYLETADLFAWTATVILISFLLERLVVFALKKLRGGDGVDKA